MIARSPEIEAIVLRWTRSIAAHRVQDLAHFLSQSDALLYVGSSTNEIWRGQIVRDGIVDHLDEVPEISEDEIEVEAWENGETGWAFYKCRYLVPGTGSTGTHRVTFVFVLENGGWKMVQHHISQPDSNVEKIGIEHVAMQSLIDAARDGFRLDQREGMASIMFTDIVNSSALAAAMGDRLWTARVAEHFNELRAIIEAGGGQFVKSMGDGTMSSFTSARAALEAATAIQRDMAARGTEPPLALRIGLHCGDVIQTEDDFFGNVVNKAARIAASAGADEVRISDATRLMAGARDFSFGDPVPVRLKGLEGDHVIYRLEWQT